ncbi:DUF4097 family beta strand repeat-containing protein [Maribacter sp. 2-571]|uniref:DUF4097 family beta strand repeat-containing protein n=1 Tax=Maribacter sp. 2-571 TaxID=3417569 RepID=UPI003D343B13
MKKIMICLVGICSMFAATAQSDFSQSLDGVAWVKIETKSAIVLKTHDKATLLIQVAQKKPLPSRAKGLKLVGDGGMDNTDIGFKVVRSGSDLIVRNLRKSQKAEIFLPKTQNVSVTNTWNGNIYIEGFSGEVEANANLNGGLVMSGLSGPVTAYSLNQGITVTFDAVSKDNPIVLTTTNGAIDVSLPENTKANLELSSWNGEVYTNFDLERPEKEGLKSVSSKKVKGLLNGGGSKIKLNSTNGNIYLRKKE